MVIRLFFYFLKINSSIKLNPTLIPVQIDKDVFRKTVKQTVRLILLL